MDNRILFCVDTSASMGYSSYYEQSPLDCLYEALPDFFDKLQNSGYNFKIKVIEFSESTTISDWFDLSENISFTLNAHGSGKVIKALHSVTNTFDDYNLQESCKYLIFVSDGILDPDEDWDSLHSAIHSLSHLRFSVDFENEFMTSNERKGKKYFMDFCVGFTNDEGESSLEILEEFFTDSSLHTIAYAEKYRTRLLDIAEAIINNSKTF